MRAVTVRNFQALSLAILLTVFAPAEPSGAAELGDAASGEKLFRVCQSCHRLGNGAKNGVGPHLNGIFGRAAGSIEGFKYSEGMLRAGSDGLVWDADSLDLYIENPKTFVSKTRMNFAGMPSAEERSHLLAYLRAFSDRPSDIPEAAPTTTATDHDLDPAILAIVGDPDYGEYLSGECLTCHQESGANEGIPSITGWPRDDFVVAMHAYKKEIRPHPVMRMIAGRLSDEEIAGLAAYFEGLD
ncbi:c-type cytochrome [Nisaea acidiphila]|uniref:C-type cytochrome n=1 Tax=Nisaea acidiphila TaxID=1862145 RepID=A0A9J7AXK5_9PROT|nr:c-type cytochrome [Nisaea acidiphila]UUX51538.1 c-type cytochrome [Nisaea acidiphila]